VLLPQDTFKEVIATYSLEEHVVSRLGTYAALNLSIMSSLKEQNVSEPYLEELRSLSSRYMRGAAQWLRSPCNAQSVVCHSDLHSGNLVYNGQQELFAIDFETARVMPAALDLGTPLLYPEQAPSPVSHTHRQAIAKSYILASDALHGIQTASLQQAIEELVWDIEVGVCCRLLFLIHVCSSLKLEDPESVTGTMITKLKHMLDVMEDAHENSSKRALVAQHGVQGIAPWWCRTKTQTKRWPFDS